MEGSNSLNSVQMALVVFIGQTGVGIIMLPSSLAKDTGHDGWISMLLTGVVTTILSLLIILLLRRYSNKNIYDINEYVFGKYIGKAVNILLVMYMLAATIAGAGLFGSYIRITLLQETPAWILSPFIILPTFYLVWKGLKPMSRFLYISLTSYIILFVYLCLLYKEMRLSFLLPAGEAGISGILYGMKTSFYAYIAFELVAFFYPYISDKEKVLKWYIIASLTSMLFFIFYVSVTTAVFGQNLLAAISLPFFNLSRVYNAPILERVDLYIVALWFIPIACSMRNYVFAAFDGALKVFRLKKTKSLYVGYFILIYLLSSIPKDINQVLMIIEVVNATGIGIALYLVLCLLLSFVRKRGVRVK